jgi:hypothetical protein
MGTKVLSLGVWQPGRELIIHIHLVLGLRLRGDIPPLPIRLRGIVLHYHNKSFKF